MHMALRVFKLIQEEAETNLNEVLTNDEPVLIDFRVKPDENVYTNGCSRKRIHEMVGV